MLLTGLDTISPSTIAATMRDDVFRAYFMNGYGMFMRAYREE
jgi:hypothetical protein